MNNIFFLQKVPLFLGLGEPELKELIRISSEKTYKKGETIFHQNDLGNLFFVIKSGSVKVSLQDKTGKEDILKLMYPGDFFGEMALLDGEIRSATIISMEKTVALIINRKDFIQLIEKMPKIALHMLAIMSQRLRKTDEKIASLRFSNAYGKIAKVILDLFSEKGVVVNGVKQIEFKMTRQELADIAGVTRETATKILNEFQKRKCIKTDKKIMTLLNEDVLQREVK